MTKTLELRVQMVILSTHIEAKRIGRLTMGLSFVIHVRNKILVTTNYSGGVCFNVTTTFVIAVCMSIFPSLPTLPAQVAPVDINN